MHELASICLIPCRLLHAASLINRTRGNRHKLKHRNFPLNFRKRYFTVRVTEPLAQVVQGVVDSPSLEIFKSCLVMVLGNQL